MFKKHLENISKACSVLQAHPAEASRLALLVCEGLNAIVNHVDEFDTTVASDFEFKKHFLARMASLKGERFDAGEKDEDRQGVIFEVFEYLAMFARLRSLNLGREKVYAAEAAILDYFESCPDWSLEACADSGVSRSYWYELPLAFQKA